MLKAEEKVPWLRAHTALAAVGIHSSAFVIRGSLQPPVTTALEDPTHLLDFVVWAPTQANLDTFKKDH